MDERLVVKMNRRHYAIPFADIRYLESDSRRIHVSTIKGDLYYYGKLKDTVVALDKRFMYCHRSYIINMDEIRYFKTSSLVMSDDTEISMGKAAIKRACKCYEGYDKKLSKN